MIHARTSKKYKTRPASIDTVHHPKAEFNAITETPPQVSMEGTLEKKKRKLTEVTEQEHANRAVRMKSVSSPAYRDMLRSQGDTEFQIIRKNGRKEDRVDPPARATRNRIGKSGGSLGYAEGLTEARKEHRMKPGNDVAMSSEKTWGPKKGCNKSGNTGRKAGHEMCEGLGRNDRQSVTADLRIPGSLCCKRRMTSKIFPGMAEILHVSGTKTSDVNSSTIGRPLTRCMAKNLETETRDLGIMNNKKTRKTGPGNPSQIDARKLSDHLGINSPKVASELPEEVGNLLSDLNSQIPYSSCELNSFARRRVEIDETQLATVSKNGSPCEMKTFELQNEESKGVPIPVVPRITRGMSERAFGHESVDALEKVKNSHDEHFTHVALQSPIVSNHRKLRSQKEPIVMKGLNELNRPRKRVRTEDNQSACCRGARVLRNDRQLRGKGLVDQRDMPNKADGGENRANHVAVQDSLKKLVVSRQSKRKVDCGQTICGARLTHSVKVKRGESLNGGIVSSVSVVEGNPIGSELPLTESRTWSGSGKGREGIDRSINVGSGNEDKRKESGQGDWTGKRMKAHRNDGHRVSDNVRDIQKTLEVIEEWRQEDSPVKSKWKSADIVSAALRMIPNSPCKSDLVKSGCDDGNMECETVTFSGNRLRTDEKVGSKRKEGNGLQKQIAASMLVEFSPAVVGLQVTKGSGRVEVDGGKEEREASLKLNSSEKECLQRLDTMHACLEATGIRCLEQECVVSNPLPITSPGNRKWEMGEKKDGGVLESSQVSASPLSRAGAINDTKETEQKELVCFIDVEEDLPDKTVLINANMESTKKDRGAKSRSVGRKRGCSRQNVQASRCLDSYLDGSKEMSSMVDAINSKESSLKPEVHVSDGEGMTARRITGAGGLKPISEVANWGLDTKDQASQASCRIKGRKMSLKKCKLKKSRNLGCRTMYSIITRARQNKELNTSRSGTESCRKVSNDPIENEPINPNPLRAAGGSESDVGDDQGLEGTMFMCGIVGKGAKSTRGDIVLSGQIDSQVLQCMEPEEKPPAVDIIAMSGIECPKVETVDEKMMLRNADQLPSVGVCAKDLENVDYRESTPKTCTDLHSEESRIESLKWSRKPCCREKQILTDGVSISCKFSPKGSKMLELPTGGRSKGIKDLEGTSQGLVNVSSEVMSSKSSVLAEGEEKLEMLLRSCHSFGGINADQPPSGRESAQDLEDVEYRESVPVTCAELRNEESGIKSLKCSSNSCCREEEKFTDGVNLYSKFSPKGSEILELHIGGHLKGINDLEGPSQGPVNISRELMSPKSSALAESDEKFEMQLRGFHSLRRNHLWPSCQRSGQDTQQCEGTRRTLKVNMKVNGDLQRKSGVTRTCEEALMASEVGKKAVDEQLEPQEEEKEVSPIIASQKNTSICGNLSDDTEPLEWVRSMASVCEVEELRLVTEAEQHDQGRTQGIVKRLDTKNQSLGQQYQGKVARLKSEGPACIAQRNMEDMVELTREKEKVCVDTSTQSFWRQVMQQKLEDFPTSNRGSTLRNELTSTGLATLDQRVSLGQTTNDGLLSRLDFNTGFSDNLVNRASLLSEGQNVESRVSNRTSQKSCEVRVHIGGDYPDQESISGNIEHPFFSKRRLGNTVVLRDETLNKVCSKIVIGEMGCIEKESNLTSHVNVSPVEHVKEVCDPSTVRRSIQCQQVEITSGEQRKGNLAPRLILSSELDWSGYLGHIGGIHLYAEEAGNAGENVTLQKTATAAVRATTTPESDLQHFQREPSHIRTDVGICSKTRHMLDGRPGKGNLIILHDAKLGGECDHIRGSLHSGTQLSSIEELEEKNRKEEGHPSASQRQEMFGAQICTADKGGLLKLKKKERKRKYLAKKTALHEQIWDGLDAGLREQDSVPRVHSHKKGFLLRTTSIEPGGRRIRPRPLDPEQPIPVFVEGRDEEIFEYDGGAFYRWLQQQGRATAKALASDSVDVTSDCVRLKSVSRPARLEKDPISIPLFKELAGYLPFQKGIREGQYSWMKFDKDSVLDGPLKYVQYNNGCLRKAGDVLGSSPSSPVSAYDMDDEDEEWLQRYNNGEAQAGSKQLLSEDNFEHLIELFERESFKQKLSLATNCWENSVQSGRLDEKSDVETRQQDHLRRKKPRNAMRLSNAQHAETQNLDWSDYISDDCCICNGGENSVSNPVHVCRLCSIKVHQSCYGISNSFEDGRSDCPVYGWCCKKCEAMTAGKTSPGVSCAICCKSGGAMKPTVDPLKWAHVACALYTNETFFVDPEAMEPIDGLAAVETRVKKQRERCGLCGARKGSCVRCSTRGCRAPFHITCGVAQGASFELRHSKQLVVGVRSFCPRHATVSRVVNTKKDFRGSNTANSSELVPTMCSESLEIQEIKDTGHRTISRDGKVGGAVPGTCSRQQMEADNASSEKNQWDKRGVMRKKRSGRTRLKTSQVGGINHCVLNSGKRTLIPDKGSEGCAETFSQCQLISKVAVPSPPEHTSKAEVSEPAIGEADAGFRATSCRSCASVGSPSGVGRVGFLEKTLGVICEAGLLASKVSKNTLNGGNSLLHQVHKCCSTPDGSSTQRLSGQAATSGATFLDLIHVNTNLAPPCVVKAVYTYWQSKCSNVKGPLLHEFKQIQAAKIQGIFNKDADQLHELLPVLGHGPLVDREKTKRPRSTSRIPGRSNLLKIRHQFKLFRKKALNVAQQEQMRFDQAAHEIAKQEVPLVNDVHVCYWCQNTQKLLGCNTCSRKYCFHCFKHRRGYGVKGWIAALRSPSFVCKLCKEGRGQEAVKDPNSICSASLEATVTSVIGQSGADCDLTPNTVEDSELAQIGKIGNLYSIEADICHSKPCLDECPEKRDSSFPSSGSSSGTQHGSGEGQSTSSPERLVLNGLVNRDKIHCGTTVPDCQGKMLLGAPSPDKMIGLVVLDGSLLSINPKNKQVNLERPEAQLQSDAARHWKRKRACKSSHKKKIEVQEDSTVGTDRFNKLARSSTSKYSLQQETASESEGSRVKRIVKLSELKDNAGSYQAVYKFSGINHE